MNSSVKDKKEEKGVDVFHLMHFGANSRVPWTMLAASRHKQKVAHGRRKAPAPLSTHPSHQRPVMVSAFTFTFTCFTR